MKTGLVPSAAAVGATLHLSFILHIEYTATLLYRCYTANNYDNYGYNIHIISEQVIFHSVIGVSSFLPWFWSYLRKSGSQLVTRTALLRTERIAGQYKRSSTVLSTFGGCRRSRNGALDEEITQETSFW